MSVYVRKTVKKSIMTNPYSATYQTAFKYFKESVLDKFNLDIDKSMDDKYEESFKDFYKFIEDKVENEYFLYHNSKEMIKYIKDF